MRMSWVALCLPLGLVVGCGLKIVGLTNAPLDGGADTANLTDGATLSEAGNDAESRVCPHTGGPAMVKIGDGCIDRTEVTVGQYKAYLAAVGGGADVTPSPECVGTPRTQVLSYLINQVDQPMRAVNWCDAWSFCKWAGKRLCGNPNGGPAEVGTNSVDSSQWYAACKASVPSDAIDKCNVGKVPEAGSECPENVGASTACVSDPTLALDMVGNVREWEDACIGNQCRIRGGSCYYAAQYAVCEEPTLIDRFRDDSDIGIRCCTP